MLQIQSSGVFNSQIPCYAIFKLFFVNFEPVKVLNIICFAKVTLYFAIGLLGLDNPVDKDMACLY